MKEIDMTIVLIEPRRIRNCSRVVFPESSDAMIAAWLLPSPGKREHIGEIRIVAMVGLMMWDFGSVSFSIFCGGRIVLDFIEWISVDVAKSPVRRGRSGWLTCRFKEASPKNPARRNIIVALILSSLSLRINSIAIQIRRNPIMRWRNGYIFGIRKMNVGMIMARETIAIVEPMRVSFRALCPWPFRRSSCPGRAESEVSSEGAPRNIEGMKSRKV